MRQGGIIVILVCGIFGGMGFAQERGMSTAKTQGPLQAQAGGTARNEAKQSLSWMATAQKKMEDQLAAKYGEGQRERARRGLQQVGEFWREADGNQETFEAFVLGNFAGGQAQLDVVFQRFESLLEQLRGHMGEIVRELRTPADLDLGPMLPLDEMFSAYDPAAHVNDDFFQNKIAFVALLNFPLTTLEQRLTEGQHWTRRQWAETRLAERFSKRVPAEVNLALAQARAAADNYIAEYNVWMYHVVGPKTEDGGELRLFPKGMRLLSHWNLRDEIKAEYDEKSQWNTVKQQAIQKVMERIVTQDIPEAAINNPQVDWNPWTNEVRPAAEKDSDYSPARAQASSPTPQREPDTRYRILLDDFLAERKLDPYSPTAPTLIARRFDEDREIPEQRARQMLVDVVSSPLVPRIAALIEKRLGRSLEPFDIWYNGFRPKSEYSEAQLDEIVRKRYPTAEAYHKDIPNLLMKLGFTPERARYVAANIVVDPARGSGHAWGAQMRAAKAHLRTRVDKSGMNYKGFNIAVHEMGHNVEQTFSMNDVDHWLLEGVPNTAFTEALAFVFQARDLELLGLHSPSAQDEALRTLNDFWGTYEIAGVALVDMGVWHWMYDHPNASASELREATLRIARDTWNQYYAPVFKKRDVVLLAVYSHMIHSFLYLPDYPIGHMIAFQIEEQMKKAGKIGPEFERMASYGRVTPDLWMIHASGKPVGPEALLAATERALKDVAGK